MASLQALPLSVRLFHAAAPKSPQIPTGREKTSCVRIDYHNAAVLPPFCTITSSRGWKTREVAGNPSLDPWLWRRFFALWFYHFFGLRSVFLPMIGRSLPGAAFQIIAGPTLFALNPPCPWCNCVLIVSSSGDTLVCVSIAINYLAIKHQKPESPSPTIWSL